jgi:cytochrome P450
MSEGRVWKKSRKVVSLAFHWELLKSMIPEVVQVTLETFKNIIKEKRFSDFNAIEGFQVITGEVVGRIFFGEKFSQNFIDGKSPTTFLADLIIRSAKTS